MGLNYVTKFRSTLRRPLTLLKNKREGMSCILMGLAPNLDDVDLPQLDGMCEVFVVNRFYRIYPHPPFKPAYYVCSDRRVWRRERHEIARRNVIPILGDVLFDKKCPLHNWVMGKPNGRIRDPEGDGALPEPDISWYGFGTIHRTDEVVFDNDPETGFHNGGTVIYDALQVAALMGYFRIGILGVELVWPEKGATHAGGMDGRKHGAFPLYADYCLRYFKHAAKVLEERGIEVFNLALGSTGKFDVFPRISIQAFADK